MNRSPSLIAGGFVLTSMFLLAATHAAQEPPLQCGGERCDEVARGLHAFFNPRPADLDTNGRTCDTCHMAIDRFQLSPASAEFRFQLLRFRRLWNRHADDPLFRAIDADDFRANGEHASDFRNLRQNGLIRIAFPLPANLRLIDPATSLPSSEAEVDVWRMVPTVNDVALTGPDGVSPWPRDPNRTGGYQLDARLANLQDQAHGALINHAQITGVAPQRLLDDLASFQRVLFTSHRVRTLADAVREGTLPLPDPDPPLTALEQQGKGVFDRACRHCHGGPGLSTPQPPLAHFHDIASQCPRPVDTAPVARFVFAPCPDRLARNARTYEISPPTGIPFRRTSSDPGRALLTGFVGGPAPADDWNKFDIPGLRGLRHTAPYFHNNSAATLEEMVDHYIQFFNRVKANQPPGGLPPPVASTDGVNYNRQPRPDERAALLAYLRKL